MHDFDDIAARTLVGVLAYTLDRLRMDPVPLDGSSSSEALALSAPSMICEEGTAPEAVLDIFAEVLAPAVVSVDSPRYLSFIPNSPTKASLLFDLVVSASSLNGISWMEAAGAVWAENQVLRWLADLAGLPAGAGGCFVSGGSAANLSALAVARDCHSRRTGITSRLAVVASEQAHSSIINACHLLMMDVITVPADDRRLTGEQIRRVVDSLDEADAQRICAVVATAGTTNLGVVDRLDSVADAARDYQWWFHVDGAYGVPALLSERTRGLFEGIDRCDSMVVDPHKWLFAPFDCAALLYREPSLATATHTQHAGYLDVLHTDDPDHSGWNPTDYAYHLTRRARGLPLWFSLSVYGVRAYREAIEHALDLAQYAAHQIAADEHFELEREPDLGVVAFRVRGWSGADYQQWSDELLLQQIGFVVPSTVDRVPALRFAFLHPETTTGIVDEILNSLRHAASQRC